MGWIREHKQVLLVVLVAIGAAIAPRLTALCLVLWLITCAERLYSNVAFIRREIERMNTAESK